MQTTKAMGWEARLESYFSVLSDITDILIVVCGPLSFVIRVLLNRLPVWKIFLDPACLFLTSAWQLFFCSHDREWKTILPSEAYNFLDTQCFPKSFVSSIFRKLILQLPCIKNSVRYQRFLLPRQTTQSFPLWITRTLLGKIMTNFFELP
jgi:hypothetical protein